jgi:Ca2+-binding EF-hand superfamily protein
MKRMTLGLSALVLILAGTAVAADEHMAGPQPETRAEAQLRAGALFDKMDLNHDGKLDQADRAVRVNQMFDRIDTNHDGMISRDEFAAAHEHEHGMGPGHDIGGGPGSGAGAGPGGWHPGGEHMGHWGYDHRELDGLVMMILHRADPGHTGTVTRDGFVAAALALFDQADTNHDGILTPEEHRAAAEAMRQHMRAHMGHGGPGGDMPPPPPQ